MSNLISADQILVAITQYKAKYLTEKLAEIIRQNMIISYTYNTHFIYQGKVYGERQSRKERSYPLHSSLQTQMEDYLSEFRLFQTDLQKLSQILKLILERCKTYQDIRDSLPTAVTNEIYSLKDLVPTVDDPTLVFEDTPILRKQYKKVIPLMEAYTALKFIY